MRNSLRSIAIIITLIITLNGTALAVPVDSLTSIQAEREKTEIKIEEFDNEIQKTMDKTEKYKIKISETEKAIEKSSAEVKQVEKEAQEEQILFNSRMRTMYMNGFDSYTSIILNSESFGDFVSRVENIETIIDFDNKLVDGFEATKKELDEKQQSLNKTKKVLLSLQVEEKQKLNKIIVTKKSQTKLIAKLNDKENMLQGGTSNLQALTKYTLSRGSATLSSNAVIAYASKFLGTPYLWGGTTPSGFDCSGFTQYVYAHFGISIGRSTYNQINAGIQVSRNSLRTGDLVLFGSAGDPHHVGIYLGNNTYIHSPHTGDVIKISTMTRTDFVTGRRVK